MKRILIENNGPVLEQVKLSLSHAFNEALNSKLENIVIVCSSKISLLGSLIEDFLGASVVKRLIKGERVHIDQNIYLSLTIPKGVRGIGDSSVVLAYYLEHEHMTQLDANEALKILINLPWLEDEGKRWLSVWHPNIEVHGSLGWVDSVQAFELVPAVEEILSGIVFKSITHPTDKVRVKTSLMELRRSGYNLNAEDAQHWAIKNGWKVLEAKNLSKLVSQVFK